VPKSLYTSSSDEEVDKERGPVEDSSLLSPEANYHTAYVVRDFPHEASCRINITCLDCPSYFCCLHKCILHYLYPKRVKFLG
jgi:hypothetical protein